MTKICIPHGIWFLTAIVMFPAGMALGTAWHGAVLLTGNFGTVHVSDLSTLQFEKLIIPLWKSSMDAENYFFWGGNSSSNPCLPGSMPILLYLFFWPLPICSKGIWSWELHDYAAVSAGSRAMAINPQCFPMSKKKDKHLEVFTYVQPKHMNKFRFNPHVSPLKWWIHPIFGQPDMDHLWKSAGFTRASHGSMLDFAWNRIWTQNWVEEKYELSMAYPPKRIT